MICSDEHDVLPEMYSLAATSRECGVQIIDIGHEREGEATGERLGVLRNGKGAYPLCIQSLLK